MGVPPDLESPPEPSNAGPPPPPPSPVHPPPPPPPPPPGALPPPGPGAPPVYAPPPPSPLWGTQPGGASLAALPPVARVSKGLILGLMYGGFLGGILIATVGGVLQGIGEQNDDQSMMIAGIVVFVLGILALLAGIAAWLVLLHRAWSAIQDGHARTTPGKAVGFLFIPLFNIWWLFQAYQGLAQDFNTFRDRHRLPLEALNESHFTAYCACSLLGNLPYVGIIANIGSLVMMGVLGSAMADRINGIADFQAAQGGYGPPPLTP